MLPSTILSLTQDLIAIPSVSADRAACKQVLEHIACFVDTHCQAEMHWYESGGHPSLVLSHNAPANKEYDVLLSGHVDVVGAQYEDAFNPTIVSDKLFGRGAFDMKGAVAMLVCTFCELVRNNTNASVAVLLTSDEEIGGLHGVQYLVEQHQYSGNVVLIPDGGGPTDRIVQNQKGVLFARINTTGQSAHGSRPQEGKNAIEQFMADYQHFRAEIQKDSEATVNLASLAGSGPSINAVADACTAMLDIRAYKIEEALGVVRTCFAHHAITVELFDQAYTLNEQDDYVRMFIDSYQTVCGSPALIAPETGASDARHFANAGMSVVVCSAAGGNHHQSNEWVSIQSLEIWQQTFTRYIERLAHIVSN